MNYIHNNNKIFNIFPSPKNYLQTTQDDTNIFCIRLQKYFILSLAFTTTTSYKIQNIKNFEHDTKGALTILTFF